MFTFIIKGPVEAIRRLERLDFHHDLEIAVDRAVKNAERISKQQYLSGPRPSKLGVVTGRLRASVRGTMISATSKVIQGVLSAGPLPYAAIHEFGGKAGRGRKVTIPPRPYLRPALEAVMDDLKRELRKIFGRFTR